jgi:hypothetical protein
MGKKTIIDSKGMVDGFIRRVSLVPGMRGLT